MEEPPAKRPREEDHGPSDGHNTAKGQTAVIRSTQHWFQDGNIVIVASGAVAFRVHRGVLAKHSSVFEDMFRIPQPAIQDSEDAVLDGCPIIHVSDASQDFDVLLQALYDGAKSFRHGRGPMAFPFVAAIVELGHKYQIDHLRDEGLNRLKTCFCHNFSTMQSPDGARFGHIARLSGKTEILLQSSALQVRPLRDAVRAVNLVRLLGENSLLPMALYLCTLLPINALLFSSGSHSSPQSRLSIPDLALCLEGRTRLAMRACKRLEQLWSPCSSYKCFSATKCAAVLEVKSRAQREQRAVEVIPSVFENLEKSVRSAKADGLCEACIETVLSRQKEEMRFIWKRLPQDLGLEIADWDADSGVAAP